MQMAKIGQEGLRQPEGFRACRFQQGEGAVQEAPEPGLPKPFRSGVDGRQAIVEGRGCSAV